MPLKQMMIVYLAFIRYRIHYAAQFRFESLARICGDLVWNAVVFIIFQVVFTHSSSIAGWDSAQVNMFLAVAFLSGAILTILMGDTLFRFPEYVNRGDLDGFLLRPIPTLFFSTARHIDLSFLASLIFAIFFFIYALSLQAVDFAFINWLAFWGFFFWSGILTAILMMLLFIMPSLWTGSDYAFSWLYWPFYEILVEKPYQIFPAGVKYIIAFVIPFAVVVSVPATALINGPSLSLFLNALFVNVTLLLLLTFVWRKGLRAYASASS